MRGLGHSVDKCGWRRTRGWTLGFLPPGLVWRWGWEGSGSLAGPQPLGTPLPRFPPPSLRGRRAVAIRGARAQRYGNERAVAAAGPGLVAAHGLSSSPVCHFFLYKLGVQPGWSFSSPCSPFFPRGERPQNTTQPWLPQAHGEQASFSPLVSETVVKPRVGKASADILRLPGRTDRQAKTHSPRPGAPSGLRAAFSLDSWRPDCGP